MENDKNKSNQAIETLPNGFARHRVVLDDQKNLTDYIFLEVNAAFEKMTGLKRENLLGKKATEVLPGIEKGDFDWIGICGKVALDGTSLNFEHYSELLKCWYEVQVYSDQKGYFTTVFNETTDAKKEASSIRELLKLTEKLIDTELASFDYQSAADNLLQLSGAKIAAINTYEEIRTKTVTRAIAGIPSIIEQASEILGFKIAGQAWDIIPERIRKIEGGKLTRFESIYETAMGSLNKTTSTMLHKLAGIGAVYVLELSYGVRETMGDIIFFMPKNKEINNREGIELYAGQLGAVLGRLRAEEELLKNEKRLSLAQVNARAGYWEYDIKKETLYWSGECEALFGLAKGEFEGTFDAFLKRVHPEDKAYVISMNQPITGHREGIPLEYEHRIIKKDGSVLWVRETADTVYGATGEAAFVSGFVLDITERKQAEEALRESGHRFNLAINGTGAGLWDWDMVNDKVFFSERWKTMLGYADHEVENAFSGWQNLWHPEDVEKINKAVQDHLEGKTEKYEIEHRARHKNGTWRNILTRGDLIKDGSGKPVRWVGTNIDLTHIKQIEEELSRQKTFVEKIINSLPDSIIYIFDLVEMRNIYASKSLNEILGHTVEEFQAMGEQVLKLLLHPDDFGAFLNHLKSLESLDEQEVRVIEYRMKHADGSWTWLENRDSIFAFDQMGRPLQTIGTAVDITERKQVQREREELSAEYETVFQSTQDAIFLVEVVDNETFRFIRNNQSHARATELSTEDLRGKTPQDVLGEELGTSIVDNYKRCIKEKEPIKYEETLDLPGGKRVWSTVLTPVIEDEDVTYIVGSSRDITERKEAEEALRTSEMRSKALIEAVPDMLFRYSQDGVYLDAQVSDEKLLHGDTRELYRNNALIGKTITEVLPSPVDVKLMDGITKALVNKSFVIQEYSYKVEDEEIYFEARLAPSGDSEVVSIVRDITDRIRHEKELTYISLHDQLTGLYNRRYFEKEIRRLDSSREHPIAVISADLDGLKLVNDTIGHSEGDRYLQAGAELLKSALRESDVLARVGGDEFALLLPRTGKAAAELLVNRIRRRLEQYNLEQKSLPLSISLGLAVSESPDYSLEEVFRMADNNMYTEKLEQGKKARAEIVSSLLSSLFERGNLAEGEREQVQQLVIRLGQALKLSEDHLARLALFAQVYDLGKVGLPDSIVHSSMQSNAGELTEAEREALHRHPETGYRIASSSPELADVADFVLKHHENYDGSGYPLGLKEDAIPVECRILSIAVAYSAMTSPRPYAETLSHEEALAELKCCAGSQFDPEVVEAFAKMLE